MRSPKERETTCGLFGWRPDFMQIFASKKVYMFFYGVIGIINGMQYTYMSATLSTLEKKFGIKSKETAYLMSGNEIAQILFLFFLPLTVKVKKRPLWCGIGLAITSCGLMIMMLPHYLTGYTHIDTQVNGNNHTAEEQELQGTCGSTLHVNSLEDGCNVDGSRQVDWAGLAIMFFGVALTGVGGSLYWCFGMVYLDDNMGKQNSPFMLSLTFCAKLVGPTLGFLLAGACLGTYVYPGMEVDYDEGDPRWVGAWWIGYPVIAALLLTFSLPLIFFPERLPKSNTDASRENREAKMDTMDRDAFLPAVKRLLSNKLFMINFMSSVCYLLAFMGFGTFMPKYMEYQFRMKASSSARFSGLAGTMAKAVGFLLSGWLVGKFKFSARTLSAWNVFLGFAFFATLMVFANVGCSTSQMSGVLKDSGSYEIRTECNADCGCPAFSRMQPICSEDGVTNFYSPCHAGCRAGGQFGPPSPLQLDGLVRRADVDGDGVVAATELHTLLPRSGRAATSFLNSSALVTALLGHGGQEWASDLAAVRGRLGRLGEEERGLVARWLLGLPSESGWSDCACVESSGRAEPGWCEVPGCAKQFTYFIATIGLVSIVASTGRVGNLLVALRCVEIRDKALSFAFQIVFLSLFAMLPSPLIFGAIIDKTCLLWQEECSETTNCLLYDTDLLRQYLMYTTAAIMMFGVLFDVAVVYYAKDLKIFYEGEEAEEPEVVLPIKLIGTTQLETSGPALEGGAGPDFGSHMSLARAGTSMAK